MFLIVVLSVWATLHLYVFWRIASIPLVATHLSRRSLVVLAVALWASYPLARILNSWHWDLVGRTLEFAGATWMGTLFLGFSALLVVDLVTVGGVLLPRLVPVLRGWTVAGAGVLAVIGLGQGLRPPVVRDYEVALPGLPRERDGLWLVEVSDIHLGTLVGRAWMARLVTRVNAMRPDLAVRLPGPVELPIACRALPSRRDAGDRRPRRGHLGPANAPLAAW